MINVHFFVHRVDIAHNLGKKSVFLFTAPTSWLDATTTAANLFPQVLPGKASEIQTFFQTGALLTGGEIEYPGRVPGKTRDIKRRHKIKVEQRGFIVRKITIFVNTAI